MFCRECGNKVSEVQKFCSRCGSKLKFGLSEVVTEREALPVRKTSRLFERQESAAFEDRLPAIEKTNAETVPKQHVAIQEANKTIFTGLVWAVLGLIATFVGYQAAGEGGTYYVFWGAVVYGGIQFLRGLYWRVTLK